VRVVLRVHPSASASSWGLGSVCVYSVVHELQLTRTCVLNDVPTLVVTDLPNHVRAYTGRGAEQVDSEWDQITRHRSRTRRRY
jgi:hypothetical protein